MVLKKSRTQWILCPVEDIVQGKPKLVWESVVVSTGSQNLSLNIENKLKEEEWLISHWSPIHLLNLLNQWYFKEGKTEVSAARVWQDSCSYLYFPRLLNEAVFREAIEKGLESEDFFGYASGRDKDLFLGFVFGTGGRINLDDAALLIERGTAGGYRDKIAPTDMPPVSNPGVSGDSGKGPGVSEEFKPMGFDVGCLKTRF